MAQALYTTTPSSPWPLPTLTAGVHPRIFVTPTRLARLRSLWASPPASFVNLKAQIMGGGGNMSAMIRYLATRLTDPAGAATLLNNAYTSAVSQAYGIFRGSYTLYADDSAFVLDWGWADLTGTQRTNLIAQLESFQSQRLAITSFWSLGNAGQEHGNIGAVLGTLAIEGESGATSRIANIRNMLQNYCAVIDETMADGHWMPYPFEVTSFLYGGMMAYHSASGEENLLTSRFQFAANRMKYLAYRTANNGYTQLCGPSDHKAMGVTTQSGSNIDGANFGAKPEMAYQYAAYADMFGDGLAQTAMNNCITQNASQLWTDGQDSSTSQAAWGAFLFYNPAITAVPYSTLPLSTVFAKPGLACLRSGWSQSTDVKATLWSGIYISSHDDRYMGCVDISRGDDQLICTQTTYAGNPSSGWLTQNQNGTEVGCYSMCKSTLNFGPTGSATPDRSGSQTLVKPPGGVFPATSAFFTGEAWNGGTVTNFVANSSSPGSKAQVTGDYGANAFYPNTTVIGAQRIVALVNGADSAHATIFVQDNFTLVPGSVDRIRAFWGLRAKPVGMTSETIVVGDSTMGVTTYPNQKVTIRWRNSQAVLQMVSPSPVLLRLVGGGNGVVGAGEAGYESYFDGANLDYYNHAGSGKNVQQYKRIQGTFRLECETTPAAANGQMLFAITVGGVGDIAPTYTQAQVLAIMSGSGAQPFMPGLTVFAQRKTLDWACGIADSGLPAFWLALFTTLPADDGTGGVEVTGGSYARVPLAANFQAASASGSPAVSTSQAVANFGTASADWGSIVGWGKFDALTSGNLWWSDFVGAATDAWNPFSCTSASPGVLTVPAHGYSNGDQVAVTQKYGGTLPTTAGSWSGLKTVANVTTDTFTVGVNTTGTGDGSVRRVVPQSVFSGNPVSFAANILKHTLG